MNTNNKFFLSVVISFFSFGLFFIHVLDKKHSGTIKPIIVTEKSPITKYLSSADCGLITVEHDGHLFVVERRFDKGGLIHHPSCPCLKKLEIEN